LNAVIKFLIVAFAIFMLVKQVNRFNRKEAAQRAGAVGGSVISSSASRDLVTTALPPTAPAALRPLPCG